MGNSASSGRGHHEETVDFGYLTPQGIYTGPRDWNQNVVTQLIVERKLAPFYRPLEDYEENWDDDQILAARKELPEVDGGEPHPSRPESIVSSSSTRGHAKRPSAAKEPARYPEAALYRGAIECPICFLYYPPNINHSRCCDQAICTECFVQIKRVEPTTTHIVSEPAACPYCVQENFGIVYTPPPWRTGLGSEGATPPSWPESPKAGSDAPKPPMRRRRKSFGANDPEVVTVDMIHPDWEAKLAAVRAAVARRANRRIIMRQVGDRLIPVGVTSGRVHALAPEEGGSETPEGVGERGSRRRRRQNQEINQFLGSMGLAGQDLEELMVMEAMRLSLLEHEAQQKKEKEEEEKKKRAEAAAAATSGSAAPTSEAAESALPPAISPASSAQAAEDEDSRSRTTTSTSQASSPISPGMLSAPVGRASTDSRSGRRSGRSTPTPQYGTISAAIISAASTASALTSPSPERERTDPLAEAGAAIAEPAPQPVAEAVPQTSAEPVHEDAVEPAPQHTAESAASGPTSEPTAISLAEDAPHPASPAITVENTAAAAEPSGEQTTDRPSLSTMPLPPSFASTASSTYDVLPSSPESTGSDHKPLLDSATVPPTPATEGEPSTTTSS